MGDGFSEHLDNASKMVASWPLWKQTVLGGKPMTRSGEYQCKVEIAEPKRKLLRELPPLTVFQRNNGALCMTLGFANDYDDERECILIKGSSRNFAMMRHLAADDRVVPLKSKLVIEEEEEDVVPKDLDDFCEKRFMEAIEKLPVAPHLPPGYYLQHRHQDSGWIDLDERYLEPGTAIDKACKYSLDAIAYGMTRVLDNKGNILKTFSCGKEV